MYTYERRVIGRIRYFDFRYRQHGRVEQKNRVVYTVESINIIILMTTTTVYDNNRRVCNTTYT